MQRGTMTQGSEGLEVVEGVEVEKNSCLYKLVEVDEETTSRVLA